MYGSFLRLLMRLSVRNLGKKWYNSLLNPQQAQVNSLQNIIQSNKASQYGEAYAFSGLDVSEYRKKVPIINYNDISSYIEKIKNGGENILVTDKIDMFAVTSGTTGSPKFIPLTKAMNFEQHKSHRIWMSKLVKDHPKVTEGFLYTSVSPAVEGFTESGIPFGSASGKNYKNQPIPVRRLHAVPYEAVCIDNYEYRHYCTLAFALTKSLSCVTSVNPSTLCLLGERLKKWSEPLLEDLEKSLSGTHYPYGLFSKESIVAYQGMFPSLKISRERLKYLRGAFKSEGCFYPKSVWPDLEVICTWHGGNAPFYLSKLPDMWGDVSTRCLGLRASEGMFSIPLSDNSAEGALATWGHFMEFVEDGVEVRKDTPTLLAHELEKGKRYRLIITTSGGLYRYDMADIIEVTGFIENTPLVTFLHKAGHVLSITGEKVTEQQIVSAMKKVGESFAFSGFTVTLRLSEIPCYLIAIEQKSGNILDEKNIKLLAETFDNELSKLNIEYEQKRKSGRLSNPQVEILPEGFFETYRREMVKRGRPEGQIKPPHLLKSEEALKGLIAGEFDG